MSDMDGSVDRLRPLPAKSAKPSKSILRRSKEVDPAAQSRRLSTVQGQTDYNAVVGRVNNVDAILDSTDQGVIRTGPETQKQIVESLARKVQEDAPRYAVRALYNEFLPCLKKVNDHYHRIAVGATPEHPSLKDCDARLAWATEYVQKTNHIIWWATYTVVLAEKKIEEKNEENGEKTTRPQDHTVKKKFLLSFLQVKSFGSFLLFSVEDRLLGLEKVLVGDFHAPLAKCHQSRLRADGLERPGGGEWIHEKFKIQNLIWIVLLSHFSPALVKTAQAVRIQ